MSETPNQFPSRLDRIEALLERVAEQQADLGLRQADTQSQLDAYIDTATSVLARSAVLDGVVLELRESTENLQRGFEQHQRNFEEQQRTTNAALGSLEAILAQLIGRLS